MSTIGIPRPGNVPRRTEKKVLSQKNILKKPFALRKKQLSQRHKVMLEASKT